jgi:hypothetical protein
MSREDRSRSGALSQQSEHVPVPVPVLVPVPALSMPAQDANGGSSGKAEGRSLLLST